MHTEQTESAVDSRRPGPEANTEVLYAEADDICRAIQNDGDPLRGGMPGNIAQTFLRHFVYTRTDFPLQFLGYVPARQLDGYALAFGEIFAVGA